ncbi:HD domain-containing phosphohydrolase [Treponema sp.]|uniref:HD domain-containing phosphohydrolase n=1 Tax=Treponema sp. TaxID=166 RepID=UPI0025DDAEC2|nr:HD domain-containing phosphohydrolase [Treponema sp.]MCR5218000.1 HD domain-containing protein [Treponema sp.]
MKDSYKKLLLLFSLFFLFTFSLFSQAAVNRASDLINKNLIVGNTEKAYSYAMFIVKFYNGEDVPYEFEAAVKKAVTAQAEEYVKNEKWELIYSIESDLENAEDGIKNAIKPYVKKADDYFARIEKEKAEQKLKEEALIQQIKESERKAAEEKEEALSSGQGEDSSENQAAGIESYSGISAQELEKLLMAFESSRKAEREQLLKENARLEQLRIEHEKKVSEDDQKRHSEMTDLIKSMNASNESAKNTAEEDKKFNIILLVSLGSAILLVIIIMIFFFSRQQKIQSEQLKATVQTMQAMRSGVVQEALPSVSGIPAIAAGSGLLIGNSGDQSAEIQKITSLIETCRKYGSQIDSATNRHNVTSQVAELVFKISTEMGYNQKDTLLHYAASLVYDIGFLSIDTSILRAEVLSKDQFEVLKTHTSSGEKMIFFVDEEYKSLFKDAVSKHHENMDGSGYPAGLKGKDIPYIARVLRVAESYVALISSRNYREIMDRNTAVLELENSANLYDEDIVQALIAVV